MRRVETRPLRHRSATRKQERTNERASDRGRLTTRIVGGFPSSLFPFFFLFFFSFARPQCGWERVERARGVDNAAAAAGKGEGFDLGSCIVSLFSGGSPRQKHFCGAPLFCGGQRYLNNVVAVAAGEGVLPRRERERETVERVRFRSSGSIDI